MAYSCYNCGMARARVSTTVDESKLESARRLRPTASDASLLDEALESFISRNRAVEIDASYRAYDEHGPEDPDEWGDLASFREAAASS